MDSAEVPAPVLGPWAGFASLSTLAPAGDVPHSAHRLGNDAGRVLKNGLAGDDITLATNPGAVLVEAIAPEPEAPVELYFVMQRLPAGENADGGDWEYLVVNPDGSTAAQGKLALCARCHAEAPRNFVFPPG